MLKEINYNAQSKMSGGFPAVKKTGAVGPHAEAEPFVFHNRLYRLELSDPTHGTDSSIPAFAIIRDRESGDILSRFGRGCYYYSLYIENDTVYVIGTKSIKPNLYGNTLIIYDSCDLVTWHSRELLVRSDVHICNTSMTRGPHGYVLCAEISGPEEIVGTPNTVFFACSDDMVHWTWMDDSKAYAKDRYFGSPWFRYSRGYYYLIAVAELPCRRYTNYIYRTKDFDTWEVGYYNPILMPGEDDRKLSSYANDISGELLHQIRTAFISSNSGIAMCDWNGKTLMVYGVGNQCGFYYLAEAEYNGSIDDYFEANFK